MFDFLTYTFLIILKLIFKRQAEDAWSGLIWLRIGAGNEYGNENSGFHKMRKASQKDSAVLS